MLGEAFAVAPAAGVVDDDGVIDAVFGVVDGCGVAGVDDLDGGSVGPDDVVVFVDFDGAVEGAVDGVATQQACAFLQVVVAVFAYDDGAEVDAASVGLLGEQDAGEQAADAAEAVEDDVYFVGGGDGCVDDVGEFFAEEGFEVAAAFVVADCEFTEIDGCGAEVEGGEQFDDRVGLVEGEFCAGDAAGVAVGFDDVDGGCVVE